MNYQKQPNVDKPKIIHDFDDFFVVYKPRGWIVYDGDDSKYPRLVDFCLDKFDKVAIWVDDIRKGFVHRIDVDTSGILLVAKNSITLEKLQKLFKDRLIEKWYLAVVNGDIPEKGLIDSPIERKTNSIKQKVSNSQGAKESQSVFYKISYAGNINKSLVLVYLHTGRTHQIRTHFSSIGHPIYGDKTYSKKDKSLDFMFLLSYFISFQYSSNIHTFVSSIPNEFLDYVKKSFDINLSVLDITEYRSMLKQDWDKIFNPS